MNQFWFSDNQWVSLRCWLVVEFRRLQVVILFSSLKSVVKWNSLCVHQKKRKKTTINIQYQYSFGRSVKARTVQ